MKKLCILLAMLMTLCAAGCDDEKSSGSGASGTTSYAEISIPDSEYVKSVGSDFNTRANDDGTLTITKYLGKDTALEIPAEIDGKAVTAIGNSAFKGSILRGIKLPDSVTTIEALAFHSCESLVDVNFGSALKVIGNASFYNCFSLYQLDFPNSIESIGDNAFFSTPWIENRLNSDEDFITVGDGYLFLYAGNQAEIAVPDGIRIIGDLAFYHCEDIKSVKLPDSVEKINTKAFAYCYTLHTLELGKNLKELGICAIYECLKLEKLTLPDTVTTLERHCVGFCTNTAGETIVQPSLTVTCSGAALEYMKKHGIATN